MQARHWIARTVCACALVSSLSMASPVFAQQDLASKIKQADAAEKANAMAYFGLGGELAAAPGREGIDALKAEWPTIRKAALKQQMIKAWQFDTPAPYRARYHAHALELFHLVLEENDPQVVSWVNGYV